MTSYIQVVVYRGTQISLSPPYQRYSALSEICTIFLGNPIPRGMLGPPPGRNVYYPPLPPFPPLAVPPWNTPETPRNARNRSRPPRTPKVTKVDQFRPENGHFFRHYIIFYKFFIIFYKFFITLYKFLRYLSEIDIKFDTFLTTFSTTFST